MTFSDGGGFEGGRVQSRRGSKAGVVGGGGLVLAIAVFLISRFAGVDLGPALDQAAGTGTGTSETVGACTVEQANTDRTCRLSATTQALDAYWVQALPEGMTFAEPGVVEFAGATPTGCGDATSATGPFYCPPDRSLYLDLGFYDVLQSQYGGAGGSLAEMYVLAHEYGHHIQNLSGVLDRADRTGTGAQSDSVRVELQADCYAGLWAGHAATTVRPDATTYLEPITAAELSDALAAAAAVGDDHLQQTAGGDVNRDTWTHGSSEERQRWFTTGYEQGTFEACDTFRAAL